MTELVEQAQGHVWSCKVADENEARKIEQKYHVSAKQFANGELQLKFISPLRPEIECRPCEVTLEDAYIYLSNIRN